MKNYLFILILICLGAGVKAQSVSMSDLTNLVSLDPSNAHDFLTEGKPFVEYNPNNAAYEEVNGLMVRHYYGVNPKSRSESLLVSAAAVDLTGLQKHTVTYVSTNTKYLLNLISQAKNSGLFREFKGNDAYNNIYLFNSALYYVSVYIKNDMSKGVIQVRQKVYNNYL